MSAATITPEPGFQETLPKKHSIAALPLLLAVYLTAWVCTRAHFMGDTIVYTQAILRHQYGRDSLDNLPLTSNQFWDFGHILWRPFGWLCFVATQPVTQLFAHENERAEVILTLVGINFIAALACVVLFFLLSRRVIGNDWPAGFATLGLFSADAFLNYAHSGNAYVVGLACLVAGMYCLCGEKAQAASFVRVFGVALMFALSVLFWFPYIFVLPAAVAAPLVIYGYGEQRMRVAGFTLIACVVLVVAVYASTIAGLGLRNVATLREWVLAAGHGQMRQGGLRAAARLAFAVPRSFIHMDRDGMWLKRYLVHDPYAPVTTGALFRLSLWKLVLFYASMSVICVELWRSKRGRSLLLSLAAAVLPICIFAVFLFEAGSIERYLPLYPFVFLALGYVLGANRTKPAFKLLLVLTVTVTAAVNVNAMRTRTLELQKAEVLVRLHDLAPLFGPNTLVLAVNEQDSLAEFRQNFPLDAINLNGEWRTYDLLEINTARLSTWRPDFAVRVLTTWQRGGAVWLPERVFCSQPRPEWNWVEGDDKRAKWADLPSFFSRFETGPVVDGEDGFVLLQDSPKNKQLLDAARGKIAAHLFEHP